MKTVQHRRQRRTKPISPAEQQRRERQSNQALAVTPEFVSTKFASQTSGLSQWSIRDLVRRGLIDAKRFGRRVLPRYASLRAYLESLPDAAVSRPPATE
jgi:hypothetical protein